MKNVKIADLTDPHEIIVAAANRFDLLAQTEEVWPGPESAGNAAIHRRYSQALRSTLTKPAPKHSPSTTDNMREEGLWS